MAASPQLESVVQMVQAGAAKVRAAGTVEGNRASFEEMMSRFPLADEVTCVPVDAGGVPCRWISAPGVAEDKVLLYLHGGGYVISSVNTHREMISRLSRASGVRGLGVDYRLAPEHPFPAAVDDAVATYQWLLSNGTEPAKITVAGDSAGGGLTVALLVALRDRSMPLPGAAVCVSPWVDLEGIGKSMTTNAEVDPNVQREGLQAMAKMYLGDKDPRTPLAAPLYADLKGLPPLLILVGSIETLLDDSTRLAERAEGAGVKVEMEVWDDMLHIWPIFALILPEGQQAIERMAGFIPQHTG